jgi:molybdate transport system substrate-binding protein
MEILSTNGVKSVVLELLPAFERAIKMPVAITWGSTVNLLDRIKGGGACDLVILTGEAIDDLVQQGKVVAGSRVDLARSAIGVAVKKGAPRPDISTPEALKRTLLACGSLAYSKTGVSGVYFPSVLARLGIADDVRSKTVIPDPGNPVGDVVVQGGAEIGIQQISELLPVDGIDIIGPLPGDLQKMTVFSGGLSAVAKDAELARALLHVLTAPDTRAVYERRGLEPAF